MFADTMESLVTNDEITWFYDSYYNIDRTWEYILTLKLLHIFPPHQNPEGRVPLLWPISPTGTGYHFSKSNCPCHSLVPCVNLSQLFPPFCKGQEETLWVIKCWHQSWSADLIGGETINVPQVTKEWQSEKAVHETWNGNKTVMSLMFLFLPRNWLKVQQSG